MTLESYKPKTVDEVAVMDIYFKLMDAWNRQDSHGFAALFSGVAQVIGFDGSMLKGRSEVEVELKKIFENHQVARYVVKVRAMNHLHVHCILLSAIAGMIPPGNTEIDPSKNTIQSLVAVKKNDTWYIELFQNTPAQFHGRPKLSETLTDELRELT